MPSKLKITFNYCTLFPLNLQSVGQDELGTSTLCHNHHSRSL